MHLLHAWIRFYKFCEFDRLFCRIYAVLLNRIKKVKHNYIIGAALWARVAGKNFRLHTQSIQTSKHVCLMF